VKNNDALSKTLADAQAAAAVGAETLGDMWNTLKGLKVAPEVLSQLQAEYLRQATALWNQTVQAAGAAALPGASTAPTSPPLTDRRFSAPEWQANPSAAFTAQLYLLNARTLTQLAESVEAEPKLRQRLRFAVQQWTAATSPSNYLALNPEALHKAVETQGESLQQGLTHLMGDLRQGHLSQTDETLFEVGRNVATTEGHVVFENGLFQLIEYTPKTAKVYERPLLMVPPCINKYYILDLQPSNSLIRYAVEQGNRVFVISWRNADASMAHLTWDDYIETATIRAIDLVQEITGAKTINTLGFCVGGTLLATALAVLAKRGRKPAASMTLLTTFLDFTTTGVIDLFIDEAMVRMREKTLGLESPTGGGVLNGQELASTFASLRPNDLVWNYVVGNYLKGQTPPAFDLLYWNSDSTNLPGPMFCWYLRHTYLENNLVKPGKLTVCGEKVDFGSIDVPAYVYGSREDHIVPWDAAYRNTQALTGNKGKTRFVMGASGHIAGVINHPAAKKRSHWIGKAAALPGTPEAWLAQAQEHQGSWWPDWCAWLASHAGKQVAAPKAPGSRKYPAIEAAPGRYVKQKA
jgi:polyhydroxyalkanoate synthase subunit PhaC